MTWSTSRRSLAPQDRQAKPSRAKARGRMNRSQVRYVLSRSWLRALVRDQARSGGACRSQRPDRAVRLVQPRT